MALNVRDKLSYARTVEFTATLRHVAKGCVCSAVEFEWGGSSTASQTSCLACVLDFVDGINGSSGRDPKGVAESSLIGYLYLCTSLRCLLLMHIGGLKPQQKSMREES